MPTTRRRRARTPLPADFDSIPLGERVRWLGGRPTIRANFSPLVGEEASPSLVVWDSWSDWASTYQRCRDGFLAHCRARHPGRTPGAEMLYQAFLSDGAAGAEKAQAELRGREREADPRRLLRSVR